MNDPNKEIKGWLLVLAIVLIYFLMGQPVQAQELWLTIPVTSDHKSNKPYNERNWGVGLEYQYNPQWAMVGGTYHNSFRKQTFYAGGVYTPQLFSIQTEQINMKLGLFAAFASGYQEHRLVPITSPVAVIEVQRAGFNLLINPYVIALTVKWRLE